MVKNRKIYICLSIGIIMNYIDKTEAGSLRIIKGLSMIVGASLLLQGCATYEPHLGARNGEAQMYKEPIRTHYGIQTSPQRLQLMHVDGKK